MPNLDQTALTTARWELLHGRTLTAPSRQILIELLSDRLGFAPPGMQLAEMQPIAPLPAPDCPSLFALCLGHGRKGDQGAWSVGGVPEEIWHIRTELLERVQMRLLEMGVKSFVVREYEGNDYASAMRWLAAHLRDRGATAAVEFHFNAAGSSARGHETLYHQSSRFGVHLAEMINGRWKGNLPGPDRGAKAISPRDRGGLFVSMTHCPASLLEPFFGSNPTDWKHFAANQDGLVESTARGMKDFADFYRTATV